MRAPLRGDPRAPGARRAEAELLRARAGGLRAGARGLRAATLLATAAVCVAFAAVAGALLWPLPPAPDFAGVRARFESSEALLVDRRGAPLHELRVDLRGRRLRWTPLAEIAPALGASVLASEDRRFRSHGGVDLRASLGALTRGALGTLTRAALGGRPRGASTLTMQLAALLDPSLRAAPSARGALAKWRQMRAAWALERRLTKDEILEAYLNLAGFRGELQGVASAARGLFGREPHGLGDAEAAILTALLPAPGARPEAVAARACRIAERRGSDASCPEIRARAAQALAGAPFVRPEAALAPHLAAHLLAPARQALTPAESRGRGAPGDTGRRRVATTLDASLQALVAGVLRRQVFDLRGRNVRDAAALVVENASGDVLAYVGGVGAEASAPHVDGVRARRQAGSSLKPFLYALALEGRLVSAATRLDDAPLDVVGALGSYRPENYDRSFRGPVTARVALASSLNVPAVRLLQLVGVPELVAGLRALGIAGLREPDFYGDSLALGSADVSLFELAGAYRALAAGGRYAPLRLEPGAPRETASRVVSEEAAFVVADILSDRGSRASTFGLESPLGTRVWSAAKTGTSKDLRDNWCLGFTRRYTVGVWVGNFSGASMWDVSGIDGAAPAWLAIVSALHESAPSEAPAAPPGLVRTAGEWYLAGSEPGASGPVAAPPGARDARIVAPQDGLVLALDPDIPDTRERLLLEAAPGSAGLALHLDGRPLGSAGAPLLWLPERGRHSLALVGPKGAVLDRVAFEVR